MYDVISLVILCNKGRLKRFYIPESFNTNFFDYKITFVNSQQKNTNSKGDFVLKPRFETFVLRFLEYK